jgi:hypothetical protein
MSRAKPPNITAVEALPDLTLKITWATHDKDIIRLGDLVTAGAALEPLRDPKAFATAMVGEDGWTVAWGDSIELDADHLFRLARYQAGESMTPEAMRAWRLGNGLSQARAAVELGISDRMVKYYEDGTHLVPKTVMLACAGYDALRRAAA